MNGIKLFFKYYRYYLSWYFAAGDKTDSYYYDNELYVDPEKEFKRDMRFRDVERIIQGLFLGTYVGLLVFKSEMFSSEYIMLLSYLIATIVAEPLVQSFVFSLWSTILKIKELNTQN